MGFDQYHEPPDELPAATRTFARLCAALTEEAEAEAFEAGSSGAGGPSPEHSLGTGSLRGAAR
jgi:hypothetical protein